MTKKVLVPLQLPADPANPLEAATKQYVDGKVAGGGTKLSALTALTGAGTATTDLIEVVDVSDTTMAISGTNKKMTMTEFVAFLSTQGLGGVPTTRTISTTVPLTGGGDLSANRTLAVNTFTPVASGVVPASGGGTAYFLSADGTWKRVTDAALTIDNGMLAAMPDDTIKGVIAGPALPSDLTPAQVKIMLALTNVDNTSDANKPVSTAQATAIGLKADKTVTITTTAPITGGGDLSANRTFALAADGVTNTHLANMATMSLKGNNTGGTADPLDLTVAQTKTMLALDQVSNTSDANKPVSTAQATAIGLKANKAGDAFTGPISVTGGSEITLSTPNPSLMVGLITATNLAFDGDEIQARFNGAAGNLYLNPEGGPVILAADPLNAMAAATKQYVDAQRDTRLTPAAADAAYVNVTGDTVTGTLTMNGAPLRTTTAGPTANIQCGAPTFVTFFDSTFTTRQGYVGPSAALTHIELVAENSLPARITSPTSIISRIGTTDVMTVNAASATSTVPVTLPADPTTALQAATKQYVDTKTVGVPRGLCVHAISPAKTANVNGWTDIDWTMTADWNDGAWITTNIPGHQHEVYCQESGRYLIIVTANYTNLFTVNCRLSLGVLVNGIAQSPNTDDGWTYVANQSPLAWHNSAIFNLVEGDLVSARIYQNSGQANTVSTAAGMRIERLGGPPGPVGPPGGYEKHGLTVSATGTTPVPTTTNTSLALGTPTVNDDGWTISGTDAICSVAGRYLVIASVRFNIVPTTAGNHWSIIWVNGATATPTAVTQHGIALPAAGTASPTVVSMATVNLAVGDRVQLVAWQNTNTTATPIANSSWLQIERIGTGPMGPMGPPGSIAGATMTGPFICGGTGEITDLTVTDAPLIVGDNASYNLAFDSNEIQARSGIGTYSTLNLQPYGGKTYFGTGLSGTYTDNTLSWWFTRGPRIELYPKLDPNGAYEIGMQPSGIYHRIGHTGAAFNWYADGDFVDISDDPGTATGGVSLMNLNGLGNLWLGGTSPTTLLNFGAERVFQATTNAGQSFSFQCNTSGYIKQLVGSTEICRVMGSNLLIGKSASSISNIGMEIRNSNNDIWNTQDNNTPSLILNKTGAGIAATGVFITFRHDNVAIGQITRNASTAAVLYTISSDYRLKNDLGPVTDALDRVKMLKPHRITWKADPTETVMTAFFAHEVQEVAPWAVNGEKDALTPEPVNEADPPAGLLAPQSMDQSALIPLLTAAVQELTSRVEALEA